MTKSTITRELVHWLHDAATEFASTKLKMTMKPDEVLALTGALLASMDTEPVAYTDERNLGYIDRGRETAYLWGKQNSEASDVALYRHAQPAPVVSAELLHTAASAIEDLLTTKDRTGACVWFDLPFRLRSAANAQPAPVVPAVSDDIGEIRVGRLPTMNQDDYPGLGDWWVQLRIGEDSDEVLARVYGATPQEANSRAEALACRAAMLQTGNSPVIPDTWIPVSERMPEDEQEVLTVNRMGHRFVSFFDKHSGLFFDRLDAPAACCIEHVLVTHWMPLPAAPQEVNHG